MAEQKRYVIGVDGGGSKTHAVLVALDGTMVAESFGGPANLQITGIPTSAIVYFDLVLDCCKKADIPPESIQSVVIGAAGAGRPSSGTLLVDNILSICVRKKTVLKHIHVETDVRIAIEAAFAGGPGIVLIGGTGSIALYRTEDEKFIRAGGWGYRIGDEGSGYAIGKDGLNVVLRQHDGRSEKTILTKKALAHYGETHIDGLIQKVYADEADLASFTPLVFEAAVERDRVANGILVKNATELLDLVRVLIMQVRPKKKLPVALMGGMLESENVYSKMVRDKIIHALPHVVVQKPKFPAAFGAAIIGLKAFK